MAADEKKYPSFFCPQCGQKHRADLSPLEGHPDSLMRTRCRGCGVPLTVGLEKGKPRCLVAVDEVADPTDDKGSDPGLEVGAKAGRYVVEAKLGEGSTSMVYRALDPETKRTVALKVLRKGSPYDVRARFVHQLEVQGAIRHPNVLPIYDRGSLPDGRPFFASELLTSPRTLEQVVQEARSTSGEDGAVRSLVEDVLLPVAEGVYVANVENGVVHRDLEPRNVLVEPATHRPYLADFGYAAEPDGPDTSGRQGEVPLSPYIAPETATGRVHARTDVWGLGGLLQLVLTGNPPLEGSGDRLLQAAAAGRVRPLPDDTAPALAAVTRKALARDPEQRYVNARQMAADLRAWLRGGWVRAVDEFGGREAQRVETRVQLARLGRGALWVAGGLVVGLLLGSRIRLGGEGGPPPALTALAADLNGLDREITSLVPRSGTWADEDAAGVWKALQSRFDSLARRVAALPDSPARRSIEQRLAFVRARVDTGRVRYEGPPGESLVAKSVLLGQEVQLEAGGPAVQLAPGIETVRDARSGAFGFLAHRPLAIHAPGSNDQLPESTWKLPPEVSKATGALACVEGGPVLPRRPPWSSPVPAIAVASFLMDRRPVTNERYLQFLTIQPAEARKDLLPATGFAFDEEQKIARLADASADAPVVGVSLAAAKAYATWRTAEEGRLVRLPTEAEWVLAAGAWDDPRIPPAPYGVYGLLDAPREIVISADGEALVRGPASEDAPRGASVFGVTPLTAETPAGFRLVRPLD